MKRRTGRRILSVLLALVMMLSLLPASVFASDTVTARKISSADQLTSGQYVLVNEAGYAPTVLDGGWVTPPAATPLRSPPPCCGRSPSRTAASP